MAKCIVCNKEAENLLEIGEVAICDACEKLILETTPLSTEYIDLLMRFKPLSQMVLTSLREETSEKDGKEDE